MSDWTKTTLGEISKIITGPFGSQLHSYEYVDSGTPVIMPQNIGDRTFSTGKIAYINDETAGRLRRYVTIENDIVYSRRGDIEKHAFITKEQAGLICGTGCFRVRVESDNVYPLFLSLYLNRPETKLWLVQHAVGSNMPNLNIGILANVPIAYPNMPSQRAISSVLSNIDRKIALNNTISTELESTACLLYDYWFTQFDFPDANGKPYKSSSGEMVWNEQLKREIPKGWEVKPLGDFLDILRGSIITQAETQPGKVKVVAAGVKFSYFHSTPNRQRNIITVSSSGANAGYLNFWREEIYASDCITVRGKEDIDTLLAYQYLKGMQNILIRKKTGSAQPHVYPHDIEGIKICEIPTNLVEKVQPFLLGINEQIAVNERQNEEFTSLRDFLLPLLMNGQVTVSATNAVASEADADVTIVEDKQDKRAAVFKRLVLSAYILDNICDEPTAGRLKFEKLLYLSEHCARLPLHSQFQRAAAGPYDSKALYGIESQLKKQKWFMRQNKKGESRAYVRLVNSKGYEQYLGSNLDVEEKSVIDRLLKLFKTIRTTQCEIVATLYSAWNDFIIDGIQPSDEQIVDEVLTNWHESKERIERDRWFAALGWMRENDIVPIGYGAHTKQ